MEHVGRRKKLPKNYQLIYDVVCAQREGAHAAAGEIYASAKRLQSGIGYSTVYRALDRLRDLGLVLEVRVPGMASALYEPARAGHAHFHCIQCGRIDDVEYNMPATDVTAVADRYKIEVNNVVMTLNGLCHACSSEAA